MELPLNEKEISDIVNKKLAYVILETENNPISYIKLNDNKSGKRK